MIWIKFFALVADSVDKQLIIPPPHEVLPSMRCLHQFIIYTLTLTSFLWGFIALRENPIALGYDWEFITLLKAFYIVVFTASFWPLVYIELVDYMYSRLGRNGQLHLRFSKSVQKDLVVALAGALLLASVYWLDTVGYAFSGVDVAFIGIPFLLNALYTFVQSMRVKVAGTPIRKRAPVLMIGVVATVMMLAFWMLVKNSSGELALDQALYLQLTILFGGICFF